MKSIKIRGEYQMAPITDNKQKYIKAVVTVIVIAMVCLVVVFLIHPSFIRCYLKPTYRECIYDDIKFDDDGNLITSTSEDGVYWEGLTRITDKGYAHTREEFALSFKSICIVALFMLTVAATIAAVATAIYFIIRGGQLGNIPAVVVSFIAMALVFALGGFAIVKSWKLIGTETFEEPGSGYTELNVHAPIIYLYDEKSREANVKLSIDGDLTCTYPTYGDGWTVKTSPDGTLTDANGREYEYLFWEADLTMDIDTSRGFCVKGSDSAAFLGKALSDLGLSDTEANTFIMYWLPQMEENPYNVICFQTEAYENAAKLDVTPVPDTIVRVNMFFYASDEYVEIEEQDLTSMNPSLEEREGFVLVEWGGETV